MPGSTGRKGCAAGMGERRSAHPGKGRAFYFGLPSMIDSWKVQVLCAGINRHEVENARVSRERISDLLGPEFCARRCEALSEA